MSRFGITLGDFGRDGNARAPHNGEGPGGVRPTSPQARAVQIVTSQGDSLPRFLITVLDIYAISMSGRSKQANRERLVLRGYYGMKLKYNAYKD